MKRRLWAVAIVGAAACATAAAREPEPPPSSTQPSGHSTPDERRLPPAGRTHDPPPLVAASSADHVGAPSAGFGEAPRTPHPRRNGGSPHGLADQLWLAAAGRLDAAAWRVQQNDEADAANGEDAEQPEQPEEETPRRWYEKYSLRGYAQFRINETVHRAPGSARPHHAGDASVAPEETFFLRRARLIFSGDMTDHLFVYLQPDFAVTPPSSPDANHFVQIRDWYADVYLDTDKVCRFRIGQSKVPYGWENLQSSSVRTPLDRNDAFNSATRNERDLGVFFYWTPEWAQDLFSQLSDLGLKPSGNYGLFGVGAYVGQGGSFQEQNDDLHVVARLTYPCVLADGQVVEAGIQGYTGQYVVLGAPIRPLGLGPVDVIPLGTQQTGNRGGHLDQRLGWTFIYYPQPLGFQAEWTIGRGPALNATQTALERRSLHGGYLLLMYKCDTACHGTWIPFVRWQYFQGGHKSFRNAPYSEIDELELGVEWQLRPQMRWNVTYTLTDRTNLAAISSPDPVSEESYRQFDGHLLRTQFQFDY